MTFVGFFKALFMDANYFSRNDSSPEPLLLVGAGLPRTATASFTYAMEKLGLKIYHFGPGVIGTPGHIELWRKHADLQLDGEKGISPELLDAIARAGFNGTADFPSCILYKEMIERYPKARVVLTVRSDGGGQAWASSMVDTILKITQIHRCIPFRWLPKTKHIPTLTRWFYVQLGIAIEKADQPDETVLATGYDTWVESVQSTVPSDQLLVFAAKDGWEPLCEFMSPLDATIQEACQKILESGETYPRVNDKATVQRVLLILGTVVLIFQYAPLWLACGVFWWLWRRRTTAKIKSD